MAESERTAGLTPRASHCSAPGADLVIDSVADLVPALERIVAH